MIFVRGESKILYKEFSHIYNRSYIPTRQREQEHIIIKVEKITISRNVMGQIQNQKDMIGWSMSPLHDSMQI